MTNITLGGSQLKVDFKVNSWCQFFNLKSSPSIIQSQEKQRFPIFFISKVGLFVEKLQKHDSLFKLDDCLLQSISLCLANILPNVFEVWRFTYISLAFGNRFRLLGLYVDINSKISSLFSNYSLLSCSWGIARAFTILFSTTIFGYFWVFKIVLSSLNFMYLTFSFSNIMQMRLARQNGISLRQDFGC